MPNWITHPSRKEWVEHSLHFDWPDHPGCGFSFDCDAAGTVDEPALSPLGLENLRACLAGSLDGKAIGPGRVTHRERAWYDSGVIRCSCGAAHHLERGDSKCDACGTYFNAVGQELVHPSLWEN